MMRFLPVLLLAGPAQAHSGHLGELAGHDHWVLGAGLAAAAGAAAIAWVKGRRAGRDGAAAPDAPEAELDAPEEAPA